MDVSQEVYKPLGQRFEFLDGLRGIAALLVVVFHFNNILIQNEIFPFPKIINWILAQGEFGVEIFFVLSGFVIAYSIRNYRISISFAGNFFIKRSIRLDPPYWMTLLILTSLTILGNFFKAVPMPLAPIDDILINSLYLSDIMDIPRILPVSWTLALEIQFYMFYILLVSFIQFLNSKFSKDKDAVSMSVPALIILNALMLVSLLQNTPHALLPSIQGLFVYKWYSFFIGCLACWSMLKFIPSAFFWINFSFIGMYALNVHSGAYATCLVSLIIYGVAMKDKMHSFLTSFIFQYLGKISYSLYLLHWVVGLKVMDISLRNTDVFHHSLGALLLLLAVAISTSIFAADIFYRFIELPSLKFSQQFKNRSRKNTAPISLS